MVEWQKVGLLEESSVVPMVERVTARLLMKHLLVA